MLFGTPLVAWATVRVNIIKSARELPTTSRAGSVWVRRPALTIAVLPSVSLAIIVVVIFSPQYVLFTAPITAIAITCTGLSLLSFVRIADALDRLARDNLGRDPMWLGVTAVLFFPVLLFIPGAIFNFGEFFVLAILVMHYGVAIYENAVIGRVDGFASARA